MKQERSIITMDEYGKIHFPNSSNNILMSTNELIELFGITYSLIAHKLGKLPYCLPMLWQSRRLQTTN